jgi:cytochrome P450
VAGQAARVTRTKLLGVSSVSVMRTHEFSRYAEIQAALTNADLVPPPVESGPVGSMAWLRSAVSRFSSGPVHVRRRALIEADLARLDPAALRVAIAASGSGPGWDRDELRHLVVRTLAEALSIAEPDAVATAVMAVAGTYFGGDNPVAEAASAWLVAHLTGQDRPEPEVVANRICLLVQACDATASLVVQTHRAGTSDEIEARLLRTLRDDPPARVIRRIAIRDTWVAGTAVAEGDAVVLDIAAANQEAGARPLSFGAGLRPCPGGAHALTLAAGLLDREPA